MLSKSPFDKITYAAFLLLGIDALLLAAGSVTERLWETDLYRTPVAVALWGATAIVALVAFLRSAGRRNVALTLLHVALAAILGGALVTHVWGNSTTMDLRIGEPQRLEGTDIDIELCDFSMEYYPATSIPCNFTSTLKVTIPGKEPQTGSTSLNHVLDIHGYRFFQMGYDSDSHGATIEVSHDPVGNAITMTSYAALLLSLILIFIPGRRFSGKYRMAASMIALAAFMPVAASSHKALPPEVASRFGNLMVMHNSRVAPLSTLAHDFTVKTATATGESTLTDEQVFTGHFFYPYSWIPDSDTSSNPEIAGLLAMASNGTLWRIFPVQRPDGTIEWYAPTDRLPAYIDEAHWKFITLTPNYLAELVAKEDWAKVGEVIDKIALYQQKTAGEALPSATSVASERVYCRVSAWSAPAIIFIVCGLLLFFMPKWKVPAIVTDLAGIAWSALLITTNWIATGQVPMAGGHETMCWLALLAFCIPWALPGLRGRVLPLAILAGAFALMVARMGAASPQLTPLQPILRSPLLSVHVLTIMLAYAAMMLMMLCGVATLAGREGYSSISYRLLKPAVALLTAGIFIGAIWADRSWGRYWGWDPKEVWALITMIIYCYPLHFRMSRRAYALFCIVAFLSVVMTYFGVNYLLGGLHAYNR